MLVVSKKTEKLIKSRKLKKITEKIKPEKKPIKILKKPIGSVQFRFYKPETEKTEPNRKKNQAKPVFVLKNRTETCWFEPVSVFLKKIGLVAFFL